MMSQLRKAILAKKKKGRRILPLAKFFFPFQYAYSLRKVLASLSDIDAKNKRLDEAKPNITSFGFAL